jgi:hypothetical protein
LSILVIIFIITITEQGVVFVNKITAITEVHDEEPEKEGPKFTYCCLVSLLFLCYFTYYFTLLVILYVF